MVSRANPRNIAHIFNLRPHTEFNSFVFGPYLPKPNINIDVRIKQQNREENTSRTQK